jgi:hypothetical protein
MHSVAGVFARRADADRAVTALEAIGIPRDRITLLTPGDDTSRVPTDEGEAPGMGTALGAVVGGATGAAVGVPLGAAVTLLVPGVGAVVAFGLIGAALLGAGGAAIGATLEESLQAGLPRDELFVYEDALRRGRSVVFALVDDEALADTARRMLAGAWAETIDAARERWWLGLRSAEQEHYAEGPAAFERDEAVYRSGFEAALGGESHGRPWSEVAPGLRARFGAEAETPAFRRGWESGLAHRRDRAAVSRLKKSA